MKKLKCKKGQGSMMLVLMIAGVVGVVASSLMLNMFNLQRASISLRIRSVTLRAMEEIAQEIKQAYDMASQVTTNCAADFSTPSLIGLPVGVPRFCFQGTPRVYFNRFSINRTAGNNPIYYTKVDKIEKGPSEFKPHQLFSFKNLSLLTEAFAFTTAAYPYLPATAPSLSVTMNTNTCAVLGANTPCIDCGGGGNANCYKFEVCINGATTCTAPNIINPAFAFMK